jgi:signal transduction histidine kinase
MTRRLLLSYLSLTLFVLAVLEIPMGISYARNERHDTAAKIERDAGALATLAYGALAPQPTIEAAELVEIARRYERETGGRVVVVDRDGVALVDTEPPEPGRRTFSSRPEIRQALAGEVATGERHSSTLNADLLVVAVPVAAAGVVRGAVRISYSTEEIDERVLRFWLILGAIALVVLLAALLVGRRLAQSFARPLRSLEAAATAAAADLAVRAPVDAGPPEVRSVAASFNELVGKLDDLVRSREEFVADAAHQLRSPLAALRLRLENLERDVSADGRPGLEGALDEVGRLSRLVDGLLALARADRSAAAPERIDLAAVAVDRCDAWSALAAESGVELEADVEPGAVALATPGRPEQVLDNLVANALEASPAGGRITVSARCEGASVVLDVVDEGRGMTAEERARAFDRLWRARTDTGGYGLGLAIVHRLVTSDGGNVRLEPARGGGLAAIVSLPAADEHSGRPAAGPAAGAAAGPARLA